MWGGGVWGGGGGGGGGVGVGLGGKIFFLFWERGLIFTRHFLGGGVVGGSGGGGVGFGIVFFILGGVNFLWKFFFFFWGGGVFFFLFFFFFWLFFLFFVFFVFRFSVFGPSLGLESASSARCQKRAV